MGHTVGGHYRAIARLGGSGRSEVSLAVGDATSDAALVVLKRLELGADADPAVVRGFVEEARLCKLLEHPNIVKAIATGEGDDAGPFLVLEYLEGQTLERIGSRARRRGTGLPRPIALLVVEEILSALAYAHGLAGEGEKPLRIIHRDLAPENVIVTYEGATKLVDFGVSMAAAPPARRRALGKGVAYMAPEEARSGITLDARADLFAVGVILWELLTGKRMWEGMSEADVLTRLNDVEHPLPPVREVAPNVPKELDALCTQALAKVRDDRFDSAADMLAALSKIRAAPENAAKAEDLAKFVASLFAEDRDRMRALVDDALKHPPESSRSLPLLGRASTAGFVDVESDPRLPPVAPAAPPAPPPKPVVEVVTIQAPPPPDRRFAYAMGAVIAIAFAIVAVVAMKSGKDEPEKPSLPSGPATRPPATTTPPAPSSEYVEPAEVTIEILVRPLTAHLFVDGVKVENPHKVKVVPGTYRHEVRAEAEGFEPRTMSGVLFDKERTIEIALVPKERIIVVPGKAAPPSSAPPP